MVRVIAQVVFILRFPNYFSICGPENKNVTSAGSYDKNNVKSFDGKIFYLFIISCLYLLFYLGSSLGIFLSFIDKSLNFNQRSLQIAILKQYMASWSYRHRKNIVQVVFFVDVSFLWVELASMEFLSFYYFL